MVAMKESTADSQVISPCRRQNTRMRKSPSTDDVVPRKRSKVSADAGLKELGLHWFAPLAALSANSIKDLRKALRITGSKRQIKGQSQVLKAEVGSKVVDTNELPGLVCKDLSNGQENICIPVTNEIDVPPVAPEGFTYITSTEIADGLEIPASVEGCNCKGKCTDERICSCAGLNGSDFPYVSKAGGGRLVEPKAVVFECGPGCGCGPKCVNRASQRGLKYRLEVYRTLDKGWAVRSRDFIPSGAPIIEYIGVLRRTNEVDEVVSENDYVFEIDCEHTMNGIGVREKRMGDMSFRHGRNTRSNSSSGRKLQLLEETDPEFCIDAGSCGNVSKFINHSCEPNLFVQSVLSSHRDFRLARIVLFAADDIPPMQELTYDYGYELDSVVGPDGKVKQLVCCCGAAECRKRLY